MSGSRSKRKARKSSPRNSRSRAVNVLGDMRRDPSLTLARAARNRGIDPRSVHKDLGSSFYKDSSGRVKARASDRLTETLHIPSTKPGISIPVPTKNSGERQLLGRWMDALNAAGRGDFSKLREFPHGQIIGGVRLPTAIYEVQRILNALAEKESPYEGLYRSLARPS